VWKPFTRGRYALSYDPYANKHTTTATDTTQSTGTSTTQSPRTTPTTTTGGNR
jgi:hypothetical protein